MLSSAPYYWGTIRKIIESFGTVFKDIHIQRVNDTVSPPVIQTIFIPLRYGPKEKWYVRNIQNAMPGVDDQAEMILPMMAFQVTGFTYDSSRKLTSTGNTVKAIINNNAMVKKQFNPVPYNVGFELGVIVKNVEDGLMIVEQILPFFTPDYTLAVQDMPDLNITKDVPIILNNVSCEDSWEGNISDRRTIMWTMNFTAKAYLYPPVTMQTVILDSKVNIFSDQGTTPLVVVEATPSGTTITE